MSTPRFAPLAAYARLFALLGPAGGGENPSVVSETRDPMTGMELRTLTVRTGRGEEVQRYVGPSYTGVGLADLQRERERLRALRAALDAVEAELEGFIAHRRG